MTENVKDSQQENDAAGVEAPAASEPSAELGPESEREPESERPAADEPRLADPDMAADTPEPLQQLDVLEELPDSGEETLPPETLIADRYRIVGLIGRGGMGSVYRAEHVHMRKHVAIKVLHREMTVLKEVVSRFEREAVAAGRIEHANVAKATDFGELSDGSFYLVLEFVEGRNLSDVLEEESFSVGRTLNVIRQVAEALSAAHEAGIVHRDLKPDNVMLVDREPEPELVKVLDFGIAKMNMGEMGSAPITRAGSVFGTPEYMAPEQAAGQTVDLRADIYGLGLLAYRLLAGDVPFYAEEVSSVLMMQITQAVPPLPATVPEAVRELVERLLEKDPERRPQTAAEVAEWVGELEELERRGELVQAPRSRPLPSVADVQSEPEPTMRKPGMGRWPFLAALGGALLALGIGARLLGKPKPAEPTVQATQPVPSAEVPELGGRQEAAAVADTELQKLISGAFQGDKEAIQALEGKDADARSVQEWVALARGYSKVGQTANALNAYERAIMQDPGISEDPKFWRFMWSAVQDPETAERALRLAAGSGGSRGADLLYAVWVEMTREETPATRLAKELVYKPEVRENASPALQFALDMREAETCERYSQLLPRAALHGDARSTRLLKRIKFNTACELPEEALNAALVAVRERQGPTF